MAYSTVAYPADGVVANYGVPFPYLDKTHISVTVNGVSAAFTWLNDSTITVTALPTAGQSVFISRNSNRQARLTTFQDGQTLTQADLEADAKQLFYIAQEAFDAVAAGNGTGDMLRSNNLSDVLNVAAARANLAVAALAGATFSGAVNVPVPTLAAHAATKAYVDAAVAGSVTGVSSFNGRSGVVALSTADVLSVLGYIPMNPAGAAMSGLLLLSGPPVAALGAVTKSYVDTAIAGIPPPTGEVNTMSSAGGIGLVLAKAGVNLPIRGLTAGAGVTLTQNATDIVIAATAVGGGEVNDGVNLAVSGLGPYASKSGVHLQFKGIAAGAGLAQVAGATDNSYSVNQAYPFVWTGAHIFQANGALALHTDFGAIQTNANSAYITRVDPGTRVDNKVGAALVVSSKVSGGSSGAYAEWNAMFTMEDHSNSTLNNVSLYAKGYKYGTGAMWGGVFECQNPGGSLTGNMYGLEINIVSDGDSGGNSGTTTSWIGHNGIAIFYGARTNLGGAGPASKQSNGLLIAPFSGGRDQLLFGYALRGNVDYGFDNNAVGIDGMRLAGAYSGAAVDFNGMTNTAVSLDIPGGSLIKFRSGASGNGANVTWFPGAFVPTFVGALAIKVDATTLYVPICNNHP